MRQIVLDFHAFSGEQEVHGFLREQFGFPDYYGNNQDALYDCLTDPMEETHLYIFMEETDCGERFLKVFQRAAEENPKLFLTVTELPSAGKQLTRLICLRTAGTGSESGTQDVVEDRKQRKNCKK